MESGIDVTIEFRRGVPAVDDGPARCIVCGRYFAPDEPWQRITRYDPEVGDGLTIARHSPDCAQAQEAAIAVALATAPDLL